MDFESSRKVPETDVLVDVLQNRMDALVICLSHAWGGLEQVAASDTIDVAQQGLKVRLLCLRDSPLHQHLAGHKEISLIPLDFRPRNYFDFKLGNELGRLAEEGVNLIHSHQTSILGSTIPWLWRRPQVAALATRHMMNNHNKKNPFHGAIYARLDALIVMSQMLRQNVLATHPILQQRVKVVNLGLDFGRFDPAKVDPELQRAAWGADRSTVVIGVVGRIDPAKGQGTFIKAAAGLLRKGATQEKLKFVIVGEKTQGNDDSYVQSLKEMVVQFHLQDYVVFAGFQENIPEVMRALDIFVMPSRQETFGLVAIEAMAMERPVVISSGGSAEEILDGERYGLRMRPDDAFDLQRQLRFLLDNPERRIEMGLKARQHVIRNYDRSMRLRRTLELYDRALRRRGNA